jgi:hypothetical protein
MKTLITALFTLSLLFAGCATVTDANIDLPEENNDNITTVEKAGDVWDQKPEMTWTLLSSNPK